MVRVIRYAYIYLHLKNSYSLGASFQRDLKSKQSETNGPPAATSQFLECICSFIHPFVAISRPSIHPTELKTLKLLVHYWAMTDTQFS